MVSCIYPAETNKLTNSGSRGTRPESQAEAVSSVIGSSRKPLSNVIPVVTKACPSQGEGCGLHLPLENGQIQGEYVRLCCYSHFGKIWSAMELWVSGNNPVASPSNVTTNKITCPPLNMPPNTRQQAVLYLMCPI